MLFIPLILMFAILHLVILPRIIKNDIMIEQMETIQTTVEHMPMDEAELNKFMNSFYELEHKFMANHHVINMGYIAIAFIGAILFILIFLELKGEYIPWIY